MRGALTVATIVAAVGLVPAQASASTTYSTTGVTPLLDCVGRNSNGTYTAVLGYDNRTTSIQKVPLGFWNNISPTKYNGSQPTTFIKGVHHGAFSLTLSGTGYIYGGTTWWLDGNLVFIGAIFAYGVPTCTAVQMPAQGNDTGSAIVLIAAGLVGVVLVARLRSRALTRATVAAPEEVRSDA